QDRHQGQAAGGAGPEPSPNLHPEAAVGSNVVLKIEACLGPSSRMGRLQVAPRPPAPAPGGRGASPWGLFSSSLIDRLSRAGANGRPTSAAGASSGKALLAPCMGRLFEPGRGSTLDNSPRQSAIGLMPGRGVTASTAGAGAGGRRRTAMKAVLTQTS